MNHLQTNEVGKEFGELVDNTIALQKQIKKLENGKLAELKKEIGGHKEELRKEMDRRGINKLDGGKGNVLLIDRKGSIVVDFDDIMKDLGVSDLKKYQTQKEGSQFIKVTANV